MILVWNDAASFNRHLESMRVFRRSHPANAKRDRYLLKDMPALQGIHPRSNAGGVNRPFNPGSRVNTVPIWKITIPENEQN